MKKISINTIRHIASAGILMVFLCMAIASTALFEVPYSEGPCLQIPTQSRSYVISVAVKDKLTRDSIPNATVYLDIAHTTYPLVGPNLCQSPPVAREFSPVHLSTNEEGVVTYTSPSFEYFVNLDETTIKLRATKEDFNEAYAFGSLSPNVSSYHFDLKVINLIDQP